MLIKNTYHYLSCFSLLKLINATGLFVCFYLSKLFRRPIQKFYPSAVAIEPTTSCNLRCPECPSGLRSFTRATGMLNAIFFEKTINELAPYLNYLTFYFQGEPYLNPDFLEMVSYANSKKIFTATSTNAHYLNDEVAKKTVLSGLDKLIISIDGITQETYESYRVGGKLNKVLEGTENVLKWKKLLKSNTPKVVFQYLVVKPNEHQIEEARGIAKKIGVDDILFKTAQIYDFKNGNTLIPTLDQYSRYRKKKDGTYEIKNKLRNSCWKMWQSCVITWDGSVVPCCFDKDAKYKLGELKQQSFKEIWFSKGYQSFRQSILKSRSEIDICTNCTEGLKIFTNS